MKNPLSNFYKFCPNCKASLAAKVIDGRERLSCGKCTFIFWANPKPTVSAVLEKEGKVLLLKRARDPFKSYWVLPGGYMEYDETPQEAIIRETKEETDLSITIVSLSDVYLIDTDPRGNSLDVVYVGNITRGEVVLKDEHSEYKFFPPNDLPEQIGYNHREMINEWCSNKAGEN